MLNIKSDKFEFSIVADNQKDDLCLIKLKSGRNFEPLKVSSNSKIKPGDEVFSLGFPLQETFNKFLDEIKMSFTSGVVSAIRNDKWGIQHTASINPGSSGGPLLNGNNEVVGVNVGSVTDANNLFFAVPTKRLIDWLKNSGHEKLINGD